MNEIKGTNVVQKTKYIKNMNLHIDTTQHKLTQTLRL